MPAVLRRFGFSLLALFVLLVAACGGADDVTPPSTPPSLAALAVSISATMLNIGQSTTAIATGQDQNGALIALTDVDWSSSNTRVARVSSAGMVTGVGLGTATITGAAGTITGSAIVTVGDAPPSGPSMLMTIASPVIAVGQWTTATAYDSTGKVIAPTNVAWESSTPSIATVDSAGTVKGIAPGADTVRATWNGHTVRSTVTVQAGATL